MKLHGINFRQLKYETWLDEEGEEWERYTFKVSKANGKRIIQYLHCFGQSWCEEIESEFIVTVEAYKDGALHWLHDDIDEVVRNR